MTIELQKKYLAFPVSNRAKIKKVLFKEQGNLIFDLDIKLDEKYPEYYAYVDVERFLGKTVVVCCEPEMNFTVNQSDQREFYYTKEGELSRPLVHFTTQNGWINDPNGLVFDGEQYHLFYQHNPVGRDWGNMHWGHAVSKDMIRWEERNCALFPDEYGAMFSGSGWIDHDNVSGLQQGENPVMLLFYTAAGRYSKLSDRKNFTQCLAYSHDNGKTFHKYSKNPIIPFIEAENRDPKVSYHEESKRYVMSLYLAENRYALFTSKNLLDWDQIQVIALEGDAECPDFYPIKAPDGSEKWVLSGAFDRYVVGTFDGTVFTPETESKRLHYGKHSYAAQTYANISDGRRIRMTWNTYELSATYFNKSMTFPCELMLLDNLDLAVKPIDTICTLYKTQHELGNFTITAEKGYQLMLPEQCYDIQLSVSGLLEQKISISLFGAFVVCDGTKNEISVGDSIAPLLRENGCLSLRMIVDTTGVELFIGNGSAYISQGLIMDYNLNTFLIESETQSLQIERLVLHSLQPILQK